MSKDVCKIKGCPQYGKPYCRSHGIGLTIKKQPKPIAPRSKKLDTVMRKEYVPQVKEMIKANTPCKVNSPVCVKMAQGFHHLQGRDGKNLTDKEKKIPCCDPCNGFIEKNDAWARSNGFKLSKFAPENNSKRVKRA